MITRIVLLAMLGQSVQDMRADPPLLSLSAERVPIIDSRRTVGITKVGYQVRPGGPVLLPPEPEHVFVLPPFWSQRITLSLQRDPMELRQTSPNHAMERTADRFTLHF